MAESIKLCPNCNAQLNLGVKKCYNCGLDFEPDLITQVKQEKNLIKENNYAQQDYASIEKLVRQSVYTAIRDSVIESLIRHNFDANKAANNPFFITTNSEYVPKNAINELSFFVVSILDYLDQNKILEQDLGKLKKIIRQEYYRIEAKDTLTKLLKNNLSDDLKHGLIRILKIDARKLIKVDAERERKIISEIFDYFLKNDIPVVEKSETGNSDSLNKSSFRENLGNQRAQIRSTTETFAHIEVNFKKDNKSQSLGDILFSPAGRINRLTYFGTTFLLFFTVGLVYALINFLLSEENPVYIPVIVLVIFIFLVLLEIQIIKRFHDLNKSGWYSLLAWIPPINIFVGWILTFKAGTKGRNNYESDPRNCEFSKK